MSHSEDPASRSFGGGGASQLEERACVSDMASLNLPPAIGTLERILAERNLVRKLDRRLLPAIVTIYILNYIDVRIVSCWLLSYYQCNENRGLASPRHD